MDIERMNGKRRNRAEYVSVIKYVFRVSALSLLRTNFVVLLGPRPV